MTKQAKATKAAPAKTDVWSDPLAIPAFLLVANRSKLPPPTARPTPGAGGEVVPLQVPAQCRQAYRALQPALRQWLHAQAQRGHWRWEWLQQPDTLLAFERKWQEPLQRAAAPQQRGRRGGELAGLVPLATVLEGVEHDPKHARAAVDAADLPHIRYHFDDVEQVLQQVRQAVLEYVPPPPKPRPAQFAPKVLPTGAIRVHVPANPHKPGSVQHQRMELLMQCAGHTAAEFLSRGGDKLKLQHALQQGWVTLDAAAPQQPATQVAAPAKADRAKGVKGVKRGK